MPQGQGRNRGDLAVLKRRRGFSQFAGSGIQRPFLGNCFRRIVAAVVDIVFDIRAGFSLKVVCLNRQGRDLNPTQGQATAEHHSSA